MAKVSDDRGMDYGRMAELVSGSGPIHKFMAEIDDFFNVLKTQYPQKIAAVYGGRAADKFIEKLQNSSNTMKESAMLIFEECSKKADENKEAYESQDYAAMNSVETDAGNGASEV